MEVFAPHLESAAYVLGAALAVFGTLALLVKRTRIGQAMLDGRKEFTTNLLIALTNLVILAPFFALPQGTIHEFFGMGERFAGFWAALPPLWTLAAAILTYEFVIYWRHRFEHSPLLWRIHATHHADTALSWLSVLRKHPLSKLLSVCVDLTLLLLLGIPEWAIGAALLLAAFWGFLVHCDVPWTFGIFGRWVFSPAAHRLHHIRDETLMGTNFGNTLTLWDRLFGTYCDPRPHLGCETGIEEGTRGFAGELLRPFERRYWTRQERARREESKVVA